MTKDEIEILVEVFDDIDKVKDVFSGKYQLIDAFSNIAFNNSNNDSDIPTTSDISKDIEDIEAKGRTSALLLKGANKWI